MNKENDTLDKTFTRDYRMPDQRDNMAHIINLHKDLGNLVGRTEGLEKRLEGLEKRIDIRLKEQSEEMKDQSEKLDQIVSLMNQGRGGWRVIAGIGAVVAVLASAVTWLIETVKGLPGGGV